MNKLDPVQVFGREIIAWRERAEVRKVPEDVGTIVLLDGVDVSNQCYRAERFPGGDGLVFLFSERDGRKYYDKETGDAARELRRGVVEFGNRPSIAREEVA